MKYRPVVLLQLLVGKHDINHGSMDGFFTHKKIKQTP